MNLKPSSRHPRGHLVLLGLILALAAGLRAFNLSALGFWTDELFALSSANGYGLEIVRLPINQIVPPRPVCTRLADARPFWHIPSTLAHQDAHPPVFFMLLRIWEWLFGGTEAAVRSMNVLFSLLAVALLYFAAVDSVGSPTALTACLLMAVASPQIQYAQEARNYMPALVFSLIAFIALDKLKKSSSMLAFSVLTIGVLAMMLTHYFAISVVGVFGGQALVGFRGRQRLAAIAAIVLGMILFAAIWGWAILDERSVIQSVSWLIDNNPGRLHRRLIDLGRLPVRLFAEVTDPGAQVPIAIVGGVIYLCIGVLFVRRRELRIWIWWMLAGICLVACADVLRSTTQLNWVRYCLFATPAAYVLLAAATRGRWRFALPAVAVTAAFLCLRNAYVPPWKFDYRTPVQMIDRLRGPQDGLVISGPIANEDGMMYAAFAHYSKAMPAVTVLLTAPPTGQPLARVRRCPRIWIVSLGEDRYMPGFVVQDEIRLPNMLIISGRYP